MRPWLILPALILLVTLRPVLASSSDGSFAIKGYGARTCNDFVTLARAKNESGINRFVGWAAGYITAINEISPGSFDYFSWQNLNTISLILIKYCERNGDDRFATAMARIRDALKSQRLTVRSPMVKITQGDSIFYLYRESLRRAQLKLQQSGYDPGPIDGAYGETTARALRQFQKKNKLPDTGLPDQPTLYLLMLNPP